MFSRLREHFGTAGLVVAIVALVAALAGGAYAATGGSSGAKATASAKGKPGPRGKTGKAGPQGPAGPAGPQGPAGPKGDAGAPGSNGANGTSASAESFSGALHGCTEGGIVVKSASPETIVCNGKKGAPGAPGAPGAAGPPGPTCNEQGECLLPPGATETGFISAATAPGLPVLRTAISFPLRLDPASGTELGEGGRTHFVTLEEQTTPGSVPECPGTFEGPAAEPGNLCLYEETRVNLEPAAFGGLEARSGFSANFVLIDEEALARTSGVWAVTACPQTGCLP